jgi:hypothetical protein
VHRVFATILGERLPHIILIVAEVSRVVATDVSLIAGMLLHQLSLRHRVSST